TAYNGLKSAVTAGETATARDQIESVRKTEEALAGIPYLGMSEAGAKWFGAVAKTVKAFGRVVAWKMQQEGAARAPDDYKVLRALGPPVELAASLGALVAWPVASGKSIERLMERAATWFVTREPTRALADALADDWNARNFLEKKVLDV